MKCRKTIKYLVAIAVIFILTLAVSAGGADLLYSGQCGNNAYWRLYDGGELQIAGSGYMYGFDDEAPWYNKASKINKVVIQDGIISIGECAFYNCTRLTSITIPDSVESIGGFAFEGCTSLNSITIPNKVTNIDGYTFYGCIGLSSITIPDSVTSIGGYAFANCTGLSSITIPDSVAIISGHAFDGCTGLSSITIGNRVNSIGSGAFYNCTGLTSITIPESVTYIESAVFGGCEKLAEINVEYNTVFHSAGNCLIKTEAKALVAGCKNSTIPNDGSVTTIGYSAFDGCTGLTYITIPERVTGIGSHTFKGCDNLSDVIFTGAAPTLALGNAFPSTVTLHYFDDKDGWDNIIEDTWNGYAIKKLEKCGKNAGWLLLENGVLLIVGSGDMFDYDEAPWYKKASQINKVVIQDGITGIGGFAFADCTGMSSITIPDSVESIGDGAFLNCASLNSITIPNFVTGIGKHTFEGCTGLTSITIGNSVDKIEYGAFFGCIGLNSITIPEFVTSIGGCAFKECTNLQNVYFEGAAPSSIYAAGSSYASFPESVTFYCFADLDGWINSEYYDPIANTWKGYKLLIGGKCGDSARWEYKKDDCELLITGSGDMYGNDETPWSELISQINKVVIEKGITSIGDYAFYGCESLSSITIPDSVTSIGESSFCYCIGLNSITIPGSVTSIEEWAFHGCGLSSITIPDSVTNIGEYAFRDCKVLSSITIGNGVESIGKCVFAECEALVKIIINDSNKTYKSDNNCIIERLTNKLITGCKNSIIPSYVTSIGDNAFWYCTTLSSITIPDSVTSIGEYAFYYCTTLSSITIPDSVKDIGKGAFTGCESMISITIGYGVDSIGSDVFRYCNGLSSITIPYGVKSIGDDAFGYCDNLKDVYFEGNAPSIFGYPFTYRVTLHYIIEGRSGWVDSDYYNPKYQTWNGYKIEEWHYIMGDTNNDGCLNAEDSQLLARYIAGYNVALFSRFCADVDGDGYNTPRDSMILARHLAGWTGYGTLPYYDEQ